MARIRGLYPALCTAALTSSCGDFPYSDQQVSVVELKRRWQFLPLAVLLLALVLVPGQGVLAIEICDNGIDDDSDGFIDCEDSDCFGFFSDSGQTLVGSQFSTDVALGDVDGDGDLDAWVANYDAFIAGEANRVWLNDGTGTFTDSGQLLGSSISRAVALGDLDGDGDLDAWVANSSGQANRVWLNDGGTSGTFTDSGQLLGNSSSWDVALGDLDGDGDLDAWVTNSGANRVWINQGGIQGGGAGNFADNGQLLGNSNSIGVSLGDLDGDGDLDAFVANHSSLSNYVWINQGGDQLGAAGEFAIHSNQPQGLGTSKSSGVALGDLDGDGDLDAWVANYGGSVIGSVGEANRVWLNDGTGTFTDSVNALGNSASQSVSLGDVDGDGDLDAWIANGNGSGIPAEPNRIWLNDGGTPVTFTDSGQTLGSQESYGVALGDLDGDCDLDAWVSVTNPSGAVSAANLVFFNNACPPIIEDCSNGIDDDGDQLIDCDDPDCEGFFTFTDSAQTLDNSTSWDVALGDLDGDGHLDAWVANIGNSAGGHPNLVWLNNGSLPGGIAGEFTDSLQALGNSHSTDVALGDLDCDGDLDAWVANAAGTGAPNFVWLNQTQQGSPGQFALNGQLAGLGNSISSGVALGDLDEDGDLDAWVSNQGDANGGEANLVWINQGGDQLGTAGEFADSLQTLGDSRSTDVALGDFDGDGDLDAWVTNGGSEPNIVWLNDGSGTFTDSLQLLGNQNSIGVALGDLDGDGDLDAWVANHGSIPAGEANRVWLNDGAGTFTDSGQALGSSNSTKVVLGDIDFDGDLDAVVGNNCNATVPGGISPTCTRVWLNCGDGTFTDSGWRLDNYSGSGVALGDLDGDNDLDAWVAHNLPPIVPAITPVFFNDACPPIVEDCTNGIDDDYDQLIDCDDPDCSDYFLFADSGQELGDSSSYDVALGDLDGDDDLDAWVVNASGFTTGPANIVWTNDGSGNFGLSNQPLGLGNSISAAVALGDLDDDGDLDAWVANYGDSLGGQPNLVWENDGSGDFTVITQSLSLGNRYSADVALGDVDGDGDLDAWVANDGAGSGDANIVWINQGGDQLGTLGEFEDSLQLLGNSISSGVVLGDLDGDCDLDAWVANSGSEPNIVWLNDGDGTFTDSGQLLGNSSSSDVALGDLDGDGDLDAWVANYGDSATGEPNRVWLNCGDGTFLLTTQALGNSHSYGVSLGDVDGDGDLDAWVANFGGTVIGSVGEPNRVWVNDGSGTFTDSGHGLGDSFSTAVALGCLDDDDNLDAWVTNCLIDIQPNRVYLNDACTPLVDCLVPAVEDCSNGIDDDGDCAVDCDDSDCLFSPDCNLNPYFSRGDTNGDGGFDIADAINLLTYLFGSGSVSCLSACDGNDDGGVDVADAITILAALFGGGELPPTPSPGRCGLDPTSDNLDCASFPPCP